MSKVETEKRVEVGQVDDFEDGSVKLVDVRGREVGIIRWGDELFAVANNCPHQGGPVCKGHIEPYIEATTGGLIEVDSARPILACAWHGWEFDLHTGRALWDERYGVRTYPVAVDADGRVFVETARSRSRASGEKEA